MSASTSGGPPRHRGAGILLAANRSKSLNPLPLTSGRLSLAPPPARQVLTDTPAGPLFPALGEPHNGEPNTLTIHPAEAPTRFFRLRRNW